MTHLKGKLDTIFVVDSFKDSEKGYARAQEIANLVADKAHEVRVVEMDLSRKEEITEGFRLALEERLKAGKGVMVFFNCPSAVSGGILEATRSTEVETGNCTRKILLSCHGTNYVNRGFKKRGVPRGGVRHVVYDHERGSHQEKIQDLF